MHAKTDALVRLVDDEQSVCDSLSMFLSAIGFRVKTYPSGKAFLEEDSPEIPGCVVLDVRMPDMTGLEVQEEMIRRQRSLPIVFLTAHGDIPMAVDAIQNGAFAFLEKPPMPEALEEKITEAVEKSFALMSEEKERSACLRRWAALTPAEQQAAIVIAKGLRNADVAAVLEVSVWTAKAYKTAVYNKLEVENPIEVSDFLRQAGIVQ